MPEVEQKHHRILLGVRRAEYIFPIGYLSKMMSHVAYSTPEGELAALSVGINRVGIPGLVMWEILSGQVSGTMPAKSAKNQLTHCLHVHGDNSASISVARNAKNPTMRHMGRVHGVSICSIASAIDRKLIDLGYIETAKMAANVLPSFTQKIN